MRLAALLNVSRKKVNKCLKKQDTYTRYQLIVSRHAYSQTFVNGWYGQV